MANKETSGLGSYIRAFAVRWFVAMSSPLSVPAAVAAAWVENATARIALAVTAILCFGFSSYWVWKVEREKRLEAEKRLASITSAKPKLKCWFDKKDAGCYRPNTTVTNVVLVNDDGVLGPRKIVSQEKCDWYRVRVDAEGGNISGCRAHLISIERDDVPVFAGDAPPLPIAHHGEDATTIHEGVSKYVDLLAVFDDNRVDVCVPPARRTSSADWNKMFSEARNYRIRVAVVSPEAATASTDVSLKWTLDRATSEIA